MSELMRARRIYTILGLGIIIAIGAVVGIKIHRMAARAKAVADLPGPSVNEPPPTWLRVAEYKSGGPAAWLARAGQTSEATLRAYFYYKDRGCYTRVRQLLHRGSLSLVSCPRNKIT